jgi:hypothetical protein
MNALRIIIIHNAQCWSLAVPINHFAVLERQPVTLPAPNGDRLEEATFETKSPARPQKMHYLWKDERSSDGCGSSVCQ